MYNYEKDHILVPFNWMNEISLVKMIMRAHDNHTGFPFGDLGSVGFLCFL